MEGIASNVNQMGTDWSKALTALAESIGCTGVDVGAAVSGDQVRITMTDRSDPTRQASCTPQLAMPTFSANFDVTAAKAAVANKLQTAFEDVGEDAHDTVETAITGVESGLITSESEGYGQALFCIYELVRLLIEVGQKEKDVSREMREADLQTTVSSIKNEALAQVTAAEKGLGLSVGLSLVLGGLTMFLGGKGIKSSESALTAQNRSQMGRKMKKYTLTVKGGNKEVAERSLNTEASRLGKKGCSEVDSIFGANNQNVKQLEEQQAKLEHQTDLAEADLAKARAKRDGISSAKHPVEHQKAQADVTAAKKNLDQCILKENYGRAYITNKKAQLNQADSLKDDVAKAGQELHAAHDGNPDLAKIQLSKNNKAQLWQGGMMATMGLMQLGSQVGQSVQQVDQAQAQRFEAQSQESQARHQEDQDVFQSAQELIDGVLDLYKQTIQAESQSVERTLNA